MVLLAEELNPVVKEILQNKVLFPKLENIIPVEQYTGKKRSFLLKYYYLIKKARNLVREYKPDVVITANDLYPFEMYLIRFAKKAGAVAFCLQASFQMQNRKEEVLAWFLYTIYSKSGLLISL